MCGRYTLHVAKLSELKALLGVQRVLVADWKPRYNIAPTQDAPVVIDNGERALVSLRWGLIPPWADSPSIGTRSINARVETIAELPTFKRAFASRRCIVPATGYFEWRSQGGKAPKQPLWIRPRDGSLLALAGLWETWHTPDGEEIESFAIVTTEALGELREIHDRMPLELRDAAIEAWLRPGIMSGSALAELVRGASIDQLAVSAVDTRVSSPFNDDPGCIEPPSTDAAQGKQLGLFD
jgi:putative SOS response-associated peptidase YedK